MKTFIITLTFLISTLSLNAQGILQGTIVESETRKPLPGAVIRLNGTTFSTTSGISGEFILSVPAGQYTIICSYVGYEDLKKIISVPGDNPLLLEMSARAVLTEEITVASTRSGAGVMANSAIDKQEIERANTGRDVPYLLQLLPSVVVTSDAGNGIGYTGIRIRGTDQSRINVTINGIPLNDAESQQVYWVDLPDFASSTENIQIQRGAGSSTNGASAFGGSINLLSNKIASEPFAQLSSGYGSFKTFRNTVSFGSGTLGKYYSLEGRLSKLSSDGFADRASSDLRSFYLSGAYTDDKTLIRLNIFSGKEITYQSWYGVPESRYKNDHQGMKDYIDRNYLDAEDAANLLNSGRTYNYYTYDNQVDDYQQDHYQLHFGRALNKKTSLNIAFHYTRGKGFYEEFNKNASLAEFGISPVILTNDTVSSSDLIGRKWLDNHFYGTVAGLTSEVSETVTIAAGGGWNRYEGKHFGEVIWSQFASDSDIRHRYYENDADKNDVNAYLKATWKLFKAFSVFADAQFRNVQYHFEGPDANGNTGPEEVALNFFNPKGGITYEAGKGRQLYLSVAVAQKEPNRDDYTGSSALSRPKAEKLTDFEGGFRMRRNRIQLGLNAFYMLYKDQLVLTGEVNDVGNYTRINIDDSYRTGLEIEAGYSISKRFAVDMNMTFSRNRIRLFREYTNSYDADFNSQGQDTIVFKNTPIAFSPELTGMVRLTCQLTDQFNIQISGKHVSQQYMDNTGTSNRLLDAYTFADANLEFKTSLKGLKELRIFAQVINLFDTGYASNGYTWGYNYNGNRVTENFYFPQAARNYMTGVTLRF